MPICACTGKAIPSTTSSGIVKADGLVISAAGTPAKTTMFTAWYSLVPSFPSSAATDTTTESSERHNKDEPNERQAIQLLTVPCCRGHR